MPGLVVEGMEAVADMAVGAADSTVVEVVDFMVAAATVVEDFVAASAVIEAAMVAGAMDTAIEVDGDGDVASAWAGGVHGPIGRGRTTDITDGDIPTLRIIPITPTLSTHATPMGRTIAGFPGMGRFPVHLIPFEPDPTQRNIPAESKHRQPTPKSAPPQ
jgi:hypothetical protein